MENEYTTADFEITSILPVELEGLNPRILHAFFDIVMKWGEPGESEMLEFAAFGELGDGFLISVELTSSNTRILLLKKSELAEDFCCADEGSFTIETKKLSVIWDIRISLEEAVLTIRQVDETAKAQGLIDSKTGERVFSRLADIGEKIFKVSEVFFDPDYLLIFSSMVSNEFIFAQFDYPELVSICNVSSSKFVCLKSTAKAIEEILSSFQKITMTERMTAISPLILNEEKRKTDVEQNTGQFN